MNKPTVIVTGGSRGIGFATSKKLLSEGFRVHLIARGKQGLSHAHQELGDMVTSTSLDLSDRKEINDFAASWTEPIWGIVNNAGIWAEERLDEADRDVWDPILRLNLEGTYFLTKSMQAKVLDGGRIVNVASQLGTGGRAGFGAYCATKHGIIGLTRCWALELGRRGICVNAVCPGWVRTESNLIEIDQRALEEGKMPNAKLSEIAHELVLGRFIEPEEVASLISFLVGKDGSGVTGQVYEIK
jgi:NAD(P)-dependent dehydrogenase (short-subunit alcohol dehydrogenase family)